MGFLDFIKDKLIRNRKKLPEGKFLEPRGEHAPKTGMSPIKFDKGLKVDYVPKINTVEFAIEQYLFGLVEQQELGMWYSPYKALTALCSMDNSNGGRNAKNEENLMKKINQRNDIVVINQPSSSGGTCFKHVAHGRLSGKEDYRLYINCKRENIAALADRFIEEFGDSAYYFKFCTDEHAAEIRRSEQFVFYVENEPGQVNEILQKIEKTKQKYPKLFEASQNMNPFMKNLSGFIGYAPDVEGIYKNLKGEKIPISHSYNSLLSTALEDSFLHSVREVVSRDYDLSIKTNGENLPKAKDYVKAVLPDIIDRPEVLKKLISNMKENLVTLSKLNSELQINGIDLSKSKEEEKNIDYIA